MQNGIRTAEARVLLFSVLHLCFSKCDRIISIRTTEGGDGQEHHLLWPPQTYESESLSVRVQESERQQVSRGVVLQAEVWDPPGLGSALELCCVG